MQHFTDLISLDEEKHSLQCPATHAPNYISLAFLSPFIVLFPHVADTHVMHSNTIKTIYRVGQKNPDLFER